MYSGIVGDHFHPPRRVGSLAGATHQGTAGVPGEGSCVVLWFVVSGERIEASAHRSHGCPAAMASASMVAELVEGRTVASALTLTEPELTSALCGPPEGKDHCPRLAVQALMKAFESSSKGVYSDVQ